MRYLFLLWGDEAAELALSGDERRAIMTAHGSFLRDQTAAGRTVTGEAIGSSAEAIVVRGRAPSATDGPFLETKEQLGGFYVIDCADRDDAVGVARAIPQSPGLTIEIRSIPD
jgi:hypothetical protein